MNKPAFPTPFIPGKDVCDNIPAQQGMTLREWYAGLAMQGIVSNNGWMATSVAKQAIEYADALLLELNKK